MFLSDGPVAPVQEAYFGKNKNILEIEKNLGIIQNKYKNTSFIGGAGLGIIEKSKEWLRIKELFEQEFGFHSVTFVLDRGQFANAMTIPITHAIDTANADKYVQFTSKGMRYKPEARFCTFIILTEQLLFNLGATPGEVTAILLHEVGHNFDSTVFRHIAPFVFAETVLEIVTQAFQNPGQLPVYMALVSKHGRRVISKGMNEAMAEKWWSAFDTMQWIFKLPSGLLTKLLYPILRVPMAVVGIAFSLINPVALANIVFRLFSEYSSETFADRVPSMYGYGPEMASALTKLEFMTIGTESVLDKIPLIGHVYGLFFIAMAPLFKLFDPHPEYIARIKNVRKAIEADLKDPRIDKKTKEEIRNHLHKIDKVSDEALTAKGKGSVIQMKILYNDFLKSMYKDGDLRSLLLSDELDEDKMNTTIKSYMK